MESTELQDIDFFSSFYDHTNSTFFTPTTNSLLSDSVSEDPVPPKPPNDEEDEYVAELTRQMTNYMLQDDEKHQKSCSGGSGSPQSTLWSPFASGNSSPIGPSREPTPPLSPVTVETKPVMIPSRSKQALIDDQIRSIQANVSSLSSDIILDTFFFLHRPVKGLQLIIIETIYYTDALLVSMKNKNSRSTKGSSLTQAQSGPPYTAETSAQSHQEPPADLPHEWTY
ncbi:unnamed protein product [Brassica napus]|uniref:(rape) hypothetical protein n=1 Tax=Brassica napus TaxID=3708 RepID=A0A816WQ26_BRANA|nr:unnamed protein product [Brassica napus]